MKHFICLFAFTLFFFSCSSSKMGNFIKNEEPSNKVIFKKESNLYYLPLNEDRIEFYMRKAGQTNILSLNDIQWDKYLIDSNSNEPDIRNFLDEFGLIEDNYGYKSAKDFFASQYTEIFLKEMSGESLKLSKFKPRSFNIFIVDDLFSQNQKLLTKTIYSPNDSLNVTVYEPADLNSFCQDFTINYPDADFLIIVGKLYVTQDMFEDNILFTSGTAFSFPKGTIIFPKVVIDLKNSKIAGYHIGRGVIIPGAFNTVRGAIEGVMIMDSEEFNFFF